MQAFDVIIVGAGAAGMMCAIAAGRRGRRVLLLDHADRPGKKILISGGGRSNFTNLHCRPENFLSANPHFARSALARFTPEDMIAMVEAHGIPYHHKTLGQLFCDRSSRDLVQMLETECASAGVRLQLETQVLAITAGHGSSASGFRLTTASPAGSAELHTRSLVIASGGLSIPKMGATGFGYEVARQFGLGVVPCRPGLVPFTFTAEESARWADLSGVSAEVIATVEQETEDGTGLGARPAKGRRSGRGAGSTPFREKALITHRGLSGPAILQVSSYWAAGQPVALDLAPDRQVFAPLLAPRARRDAAAALQAVKTVLAARWAERWMALHLPKAPMQDLTNATIARLEQSLHAWRVTPAGTEGYPKAEVTAGGVDTSELDARTLEARRQPGLYFIGEVVDVTGWLGGYNFQWAWASGWCAGEAV